MRVHVLPPVPHLDLTPEPEWDAYVQKVLNLTRMLTNSGHDVYYYGSVNSHPYGKLIPVWDDDDMREWFGDRDWRTETFDGFSPDDPWWKEIDRRICGTPKILAQPGDVLACTMGLVHSPIANAFGNELIPFESGIGYEGSFADYRVFESRAWQHHTYGRQSINDGRFYDTVIPNAYDPDKYIPTYSKGDYLLFMARNTPRKGTAIVEEVAKHHRVVQAGQGGAIPGCDYLGVVTGPDKIDLLSNARALLSPTLYIEPFGGVAVEAQLSATPVIATPWGAYPETILNGHTGFLCHSLARFLVACDAVEYLDLPGIRSWAEDQFSLQKVGRQYDSYLSHLSTLHGEGWYANSPVLS